MKDLYTPTYKIIFYEKTNRKNQQKHHRTLKRD